MPGSYSLSYGNLTEPFETGDIQPGQAIVQRQSTCPSSCTKRFKEPINIVAFVAHGHYLVHKAVTALYDENQNLKQTIYRRDFHDNFMQEFQQLKPPVVVNPGDMIHSSHYYDTSYATKTFPYGESNEKEMFASFALYYPRQNMGVDVHGKPLLFSTCGLLVFNMR